MAKKLPHGRKTSKSRARKMAWSAFARFIKSNHADSLGMCRCVTCTEVHPFNSPYVHAGHFVAGRTNSVLLDEELVRPQCCKCNIFNGGEQARFLLYLKREEGKTDEQIEEMLGRKHRVVKYSTQDYLDKAEEYNNKADAIIRIKGI